MPAAPLTIVRIPVVPLKVVNAHLVLQGDRALLVDAGLPGFEEKVERALARHGLGWSALAAIVITHAHVDHAGGAARLKERSNATVIAHRAELPFLLGERAMTLCPTGWAGRAFYRMNLIHRRYRPVTPDVLLEGDGRLDLRPYGFDGEVVTCAGHTPGALSVTLSTGEALVGDLVASGFALGGLFRLHRPIRPPFEADPPQVANALRGLLAQGVNRFHLGHGGPLPATAVADHVETLGTVTADPPRLQRLPPPRT